MRDSGGEWPLIIALWLLLLSYAIPGKKDAERDAELKQLRAAVKMYSAEKGNE